MRAPGWLTGAFTTRVGWYQVGALVGTFGVPLTAGLAYTAPENRRWLFVVASTVCAAAAFTLKELRQKALDHATSERLAEARAEAARELADLRTRTNKERAELKARIEDLQKQIVARQAETRVKLNSYLNKIGNLLAGMFDLADGDKKGQNLLLAQTVCEAAAALSSTGRRARCTWYQVAPSEALVPFLANANHRTPRKTFEPNGKAWKAIRAVVENAIEGKGEQVDCYQFYPDLTVDAPPGFVASKGRPYLTYVGVPVFAGKSWVGWLSVDSPNAGDLDEVVDVPLMQVLASLLAVAYIHADQDALSVTKGKRQGTTR